MHKTRAFTQDLRSNLGVLAVRDSEIPVATRADVASNHDPLGVKRGRICVMCDRKFMLYDYYADFACQVEEMDALIKEEKLLLTERYHQFRNAKKEMLLMKEMLASKGHQLKTVDSDEIQRHEAIEHRKEKLSTDTETLRERLKQREYHFQELAVQERIIKEDIVKM